MILGMIKGQYFIYFRMTDIKEGKKETIRFDNYLKEECHDLYSVLITQGKRKSRLFFKVLRKINFHGYGLLRTILHVYWFARSG